MTTRTRIQTLALLAASVQLLHAQSYTITTIAGTNTIQDGIPASRAFLRQPQAVQIDSAGSIYVLDQLDLRVRRIDPSGVITTVAGNGLVGFSGDGGPASNASLNSPNDIALDRHGLRLYIADTGNHRVRQVDLTSGTITTLAGSGSSTYAGDGGPAVKAGLNASNVAVDASGNIYLSDSTTQVVRKVDPSSGIITTFAGTGLTGHFGDGGPASSAWLNYPGSITTDTQFLYIADVGSARYGNSLIRRVDLTTHIITTLAGGGNVYSDGDSAQSASVPLLQAYFALINYLSADAAGNLLIDDYGALRYIASGSTVVTGVAGTYYAFEGPTYSGDGAGTLKGIQFNNAYGVAIAGANDYLIADAGNRRLRRIRHGGIQTIAGFLAADGLPATSTTLNHPTGAAVDSAGDLFIADTQNNRFRRAAAGTGTVSTILASDGITGKLDRLELRSGRTVPFMAPVQAISGTASRAQPNPADSKLGHR